MALSTVSPLRVLHASEALGRRIVTLYHLLLIYRILTIYAAVATLSFLLPHTVFAQAVPVVTRPQAVGVLQFMASQPDDRGKWLYGLDASAEIKSVHFWGVRADVSGQRWNSFATRYFAGLGPQVAFRHNAIIFHGAALEGVSRNRMWMPPPPPPPPSTVSAADSEHHHGYYSQPETNFAIRAGGGVDVHLSDRWLLRAVEVAFTNSFSSHSSHTVEYSDGIAYIF